MIRQIHRHDARIAWHFVGWAARIGTHARLRYPDELAALHQRLGQVLLSEIIMMCVSTLP